MVELSKALLAFRGHSIWTPLYQATPSGPLEQTHTLDPTPDTPRGLVPPDDPIIKKRMRFNSTYDV